MDYIFMSVNSCHVRQLTSYLMTSPLLNLLGSILGYIVAVAALDVVVKLSWPSTVSVVFRNTCSPQP